MVTDGGAPQEIPVLRPCGDMDHATVGSFADELQQLCAQHRAVIVDLAGVTFGDSTFLNTLIHAETRTDLRLTGVPDTIARVFAITAMDEVLAIYPTCEAAQTAPPRSGDTA
ncbi:STAS domain-containing protein [Streptomyces sp. NPDC102279]|uniref:STAS domain-containing protein n=1 Tax=Streptomyces sp. NPDC102279 TaxID=3366153 RepID=UPI0038261D94